MDSAYSSIKEIFDSMKSAPFLFIGSGFTKRYCATPSWRELLEKFAKYTKPSHPYSFESYANKHKNAGNSNNITLLPSIASDIAKDFDDRFFDDLDFANSWGFSDHDIHAGISPFKLAIAKQFQQTKKSNLAPSLQEELSDLAIAAVHSIDGIITTNYDSFLESIFNDFTPYIGQDDLIFSEATGILEIYKIHGCQSKPESIVITAEDYNSFKEKKNYLVAKLLSFFMEHPIVFIGYSISDSNIEDIFESIANCLEDRHLSVLAKRLIFVEYVREEIDTPQIDRKTFKFKNNSLTITKISLHSFAPLFKHLLAVKRSYNPDFIKHCRRDIYKTIVTNSPTELIRVISDKYIKHNDTSRIVGFSITNHNGHVIPDNDSVYANVILKNMEFDIKTFIESFLPDAIKRNSGGFPYFYYINKYQEKYPDNNLPDIIQTYVNEHTTLDSFLGSQNKKEKAKKQTEYHTLDYYDETVTNRFFKISLLSEQELGNGKLFTFLKDYLERKKASSENSKALGKEVLGDDYKYISQLRRLIRMCDWLENCKSKPSILEEE